MADPAPDDFIPGLRFHRLTRLYDPLMKWLMREELLKGEVIRQAGLGPGMRVLDVGCGTGTLTVMARRAQPATAFVGLDGDPRMLRTARAKSEGLGIHWQVGRAQALPFPSGSFQRVVTSLVIHHLDAPGKRAAFREAYRVLTPGGRLVVLDFCRPRSWPARVVGQLRGHLEHADDNLAGRLPGFMVAAGFTSVDEVARFATLFGPVAVWRADRQD